MLKPTGYPGGPWHINLSHSNNNYNVHKKLTFNQKGTYMLSHNSPVNPNVYSYSMLGPINILRNEQYNWGDWLRISSWLSLNHKVVSSLPFGERELEHKMWLLHSSLLHLNAEVKFMFVYVCNSM